MSEVTYTPEQSQAINDQDLDILVSASAGSGKTKVLVERVLQKILNQSNPTPVSKLLIVTFTEAAASEMKEKIQTAIEKAIAAPENQNNDFLNQQLVDVQTANISTLHAFCLDVIRRFYYVIDLDPTFSLLTDETQAQLLREQSLANVFNRHFEEGDQEFISFIENFTGDRDFETAKAIILDLYYTAIAMPDYESLFEQLDASILCRILA
ncbi:UvrD-helicase domain-containing protein [Amylolactobacillus amylophilus]|uniref:UvrD-helicase domain-containing protein n=1 Tax=Amylolactobacillus amylophilus TaxID=1603 RepID=UPI0006CFF19F|nr:UvrD-helicase domain-containing protein [Amylolactobacillus amylophilus]